MQPRLKYVEVLNIMVCKLMISLTLKYTLIMFTEN